MKIGITGSNGYLGNYLAEKFSKIGFNVIKFQRKKDHCNNFKYRFFDLKIAQDYDLKEIDVIIHCAYDFSIRKWSTIKDINVNKSIDFINQAKKQGVKKIYYISTLSSFSKAVSNYGKAKFIVEQKIKDSRTFIIKPGIIVGSQLGGIANTLHSLSNLMYFLPIPYAKGSKLFITYRSKIFELISKSISKEIEISQITNVVSCNGCSLINLIKKLNELKGIKSPIFIKLPPFIFYVILFLYENIFRNSKINTDSLVSLIKSNNEINDLFKL